MIAHSVVNMLVLESKYSEGPQMARKVFSYDPAHPKYPVAFVRFQKSPFSQDGAEFEFMKKLSLRCFGSVK